MKVPRISLGYSRYSDAAVEARANTIVSSMTDNPNFVDPVPTLVQLQAALTKFSDARIAASVGGFAAVAEKNKCRRELLALIIQLGDWVMFTANGDEAILASSGYSLNKMPEPAHIVTPSIVQLFTGKSAGEMIAAVTKVPGAKSYVHDITDALPGEDTVWTSNTSTRCSFVFTNLTRGKQYWVRVAAVGSDNQVAYSPIAEQFAQ